MTSTRRVNFTGRKRIERAHVPTLRVTHPDDDSVLLDVQVDLDDLELDPSAVIVLDAYRKSTRERIAMGTVASPLQLAARRLELFSDPHGIQYRLAVIAPGDAGEPGVLLGVADRLRAAGEDDGPTTGRPLLPFRSDPGLGQRVWALDLNGDDPFVRINPSIGPWNDFVRQPTFAALVLPEILGQVVRWLVETRVGDEEDGPIADWVEFIDRLGCELPEPGIEPDADEMDVLVDDVAMRFASRYGFVDRLAQQIASEES